MRSTYELNALMEIDHVIRVQNGVAIDREPDGGRIKQYAPECYWEWFGPRQHIETGTGWTLLNGYSGQHGYGGPIMHQSEYIGGRMETDILAQDGYYVAVACDVLDQVCDTCGESSDNLGEDAPCPREGCNGTMQDEDEAAGWAVAYRPLEDES